MNLIDIAQYAPHALLVLCCVGMAGLPGPTLQKPNTWHMTMFIIAGFSAFNIGMNPIYDYFHAESYYWQLVAEHGKDAAYNMWLMVFAYIYYFLTALDLATFWMVRKFSQKGRAAIAFLMAGFMLVNIATVSSILAQIEGISTISFFGFNILNATNGIYFSYEKCILFFNVLEAGVLLGAYRGWSRGNIISNVSAFFGFNRNLRGWRAGLTSIRYRGIDKGTSP